MKKETALFLYRIHGEGKINFRVIKHNSYSKNLYGYFDELESDLTEYNDEGYNIYFVVNSGGTKSKEINKINAVYIDFDRGKDENNKYFPLEVTRKYKDECLEKIDEFIYPPTFIVETRNGLHVYWLIEDCDNVAQFSECQDRLINYFDSDEHISTPEHIMRVPGFNWVKDINNPFMCDVIYESNYKYNLDDILSVLPPAKEVKSTTHNNNKNINDTIGSTFTESSNIKLIEQLDVDSLQQLIKPTRIIVKSNEEVIDYLKKQDLKLFLGLGTHFNCIFHNDANPSANIFLDPSTQYYWYKCFSSKCGRILDIISVVEALTNSNFYDAVTFLKKVYKITYEESTFIKEKKDNMIEFISLLQSTTFQDCAPNLYRVLDRYVPYYIQLTCFAMDKIYTENFTDLDGNPVFFIDLKHIQQLFNVDKTRANKLIGIFSFLGLLNKLDDKNVPKYMLDKAYSISKSKGRQCRISFYSIPQYSKSLLKYCENKAKLYKEHGFTVKGFGRELLLRALGEAEANRVYPQMIGKSLTKKSEDFVENIDEIIEMSIVKYGYVTEAQIIKNLEGKIEINKTRLKRILPYIILKKGLSRIKANKELKSLYGIADSGYPFIICPDKNRKV